MEKLIDNFDSSWDVSELTVCLWHSLFTVCTISSLSAMTRLCLHFGRIAKLPNTVW